MERNLTEIWETGDIRAMSANYGKMWKMDCKAGFNDWKRSEFAPKISTFCTKEFLAQTHLNWQWQGAYHTPYAVRWVGRAVRAGVQEAGRYTSTSNEAMFMMDFVSLRGSQYQTLLNSYFDSLNIGSEVLERDFAGRRFIILDNSEREVSYRGAWYFVQLEDGRRGIIHWWYAM